MTSQQKLRVLIKEAVRLCDRDCPNPCWRGIADEWKEAALLEGKTLYLGHVRYAIFCVAYDACVPASEILRAVGINAEYRARLARDHRKAVKQHPALREYPAILTAALRAAEERFNATPNLVGYVPNYHFNGTGMRGAGRAPKDSILAVTI